MSDPIHEQVIQHLASKMPMTNINAEDPIPQRQSVLSRAKTDDLEVRSIEMDINSSNEEHPQAMSISLIYEMFSSLKQEIAELRQKEVKIDLSQVKKECIEEVTSNVSSTIDIELAKVRTMEKDLIQCKQQNQIQSEVVERMHVQYLDVVQRLDNLELTNSQALVSITGLYVAGKKEDWKVQIVEFISNNLSIDVEVIDVYQLGNAEPRLLVATLGSLEQKRLVLEYKYFLKNIKIGGKSVYINNYFPLQHQEKRRRERDILSQLDNIEGVDVGYAKGGLAIQGEIYKKKVNPPSPKEMIQLSTDEIGDILKLKTIKGAKITQEKSSFVAYTAKVNSFEEVRKLYIKLKLIQPEARHIPCAYWLPNAEIPYSTDFHDDEEPGAGRTILDLLKKFSLKSRVIFVARKYGGIKMGADRFKCYTEAAKSSVLNDPSNTSNLIAAPAKAANTHRSTPSSSTVSENQETLHHHKLSNDRDVTNNESPQTGSSRGYSRPSYHGRYPSRNSRSYQRSPRGYRGQTRQATMYQSRYLHYNPRGRNLLEFKGDTRDRKQNYEHYKNSDLRGRRRAYKQKRDSDVD